MLLAGHAELALARNARQKGDWSLADQHREKAAQTFVTLTQVAPSHPRGRLGLARASYEARLLRREQSGDPQPQYLESLRHAEAALQLDPELGEAHLHSAYTLLLLAYQLVHQGQ